MNTAKCKRSNCRGHFCYSLLFFLLPHSPSFSPSCRCCCCSCCCLLRLPCATAPPATASAGGLCWLPLLAALATCSAVPVAIVAATAADAVPASTISKPTLRKWKTKTTAHDIMPSADALAILIPFNCWIMSKTSLCASKLREKLLFARALM